MMYGTHNVKLKVELGVTYSLIWFKQFNQEICYHLRVLEGV